MSRVIYSDGAIGLMARALQRRAPRQVGSLFEIVAADSASSSKGHTGRLLSKHVYALRKKQLIERRDIGIGVLRWFPTDAGRRVVSYIQGDAA